MKKDLTKELIKLSNLPSDGYYIELPTNLYHDIIEIIFELTKLKINDTVNSWTIIEWSDVCEILDNVFLLDVDCINVLESIALLEYNLVFRLINIDSKLSVVVSTFGRVEDINCATYMKVYDILEWVC